MSESRVEAAVATMKEVEQLLETADLRAREASEALDAVGIPNCLLAEVSRLTMLHLANLKDDVEAAERRRK